MKKMENERWNMFLLFLLIILVIIILIDLLIFKLAQRNKKKRIIAGILLIITSPVCFFLTAISIIPFDEHGFAAGFIAVSYTFIYLLNALYILIMGLLTDKLY